MTSWRPSAGASTSGSGHQLVVGGGEGGDRQGAGGGGEGRPGRVAAAVGQHGCHVDEEAGVRQRAAREQVVEQLVWPRRSRRGGRRGGGGRRPASGGRRRPRPGSRCDEPRRGPTRSTGNAPDGVDAQQQPAPGGAGPALGEDGAAPRRLDRRARRARRRRRARRPGRPRPAPAAISSSIAIDVMPSSWPTASPVAERGRARRRSSPTARGPDPPPGAACTVARPGARRLGQRGARRGRGPGRDGR